MITYFCHIPVIANSIVIYYSGFYVYMLKLEGFVFVCLSVLLLLIVVLPNIGDIIAYRHGLHFCCQEVYPLIEISNLEPIPKFDTIIARCCFC